jgi:hypothetical protein
VQLAVNAPSTRKARRASAAVSEAGTQRAAVCLQAGWHRQFQRGPCFIHRKEYPMNLKTTLIASAAAAFAVTGLAMADDDVTFAQLDGNRDGMVTRAEIPADHKMAGKFAEIDTDGNGSISQAEFDTWKAMKADRKSEDS